MFVGRILGFIPVSYTHLDVYKRQDLLSKTICSGDFNPFSGIIYSQDKTIRNRANQTLSPTDIITMDWLSDNIIGEIPVIEELEEDAKPVAMKQGLDS